MALVTVLASVTPVAAASPSFNCRYARKEDEKAICKSDLLAHNDRLGTRAFEQAKQRNRAGALAISRSFLRQRAACGSNVTCIAAAQTQEVFDFGSVQRDAFTPVQPSAAQPEATYTPPAATEAVPQDALTGGVPIELSSIQITAVQRGMATFLKDPTSALFSGNTLAARQPSGDIVACGLVNGKNSYGGYTGATLYIAFMRGETVYDAATLVDDRDNIVAGMCRKYGVPL